MAFSIKHTDRGWEWSCASSAYGAAVGVERTLAEAKIELYIAEAAMYETPLPRAVVAAMRADPDKFAADFTDPPKGEPVTGATDLYEGARW